jgi:dinuclear metal center YbgI/SA1388 family protein
MASRDEIVAYANELLEVERWEEFAPAGLQVVGAPEVRKLVCAVSSSRELFERAEASGAELVLVHHGVVWRNEPRVIDARMKGRLEVLFRANVNLVAYHLALDAHPELGNNALLARRLGVVVERPFAEVGVGGALREPCSLDELVERVRTAVEREPLVFAYGPATVTRAAIASGAGGGYLIDAAAAGYDVLVTGEPEEPALHTARELGIHFVAAGHYATERLGVQALAERLAERFGLEWEFVELPNPV